MRILRFFAVFIFVSLFAYPLYSHKRALYDIVIDTDCGVDDFRALTYFLASRDYNINAITTVDGVFSPIESANYVRMLLEKYQHQGIPVGVGKDYEHKKKYRNHAEPQWQNIFPDINLQDDFPDAVELMYQAVINSRKSSIIVAMGPLSNVAELFRQYPEVIGRVDNVLWYSRIEDSKPVGHNYDLDPDAFNYLNENNVPIKAISGGGHKYSDDFLEMSQTIENSVYAETFNKMLEGFNLSYYWDDIMPFYLSYSSLFSETLISTSIIKVQPKREAFFDVLATSVLNYDKPDEGVIFNEIPTSGYMLRSDMHQHVDTLLEKHGYQEFKISALTSEIHSHLGIYSIVGAKMGLRIMEYLHVGLDEVRIVSYAGLRPPISCLNDGIQVGTGATIGYGAITAEHTENPIPSVKVIYNNREVLFTLKDDIAQDIRSTISSLVRKYGLASEMYWDELRKISIEYWKNIYRFEAFDIEIVRDWIE